VNFRAHKNPLILHRRRKWSASCALTRCRGQLSRDDQQVTEVEQTPDIYVAYSARVVTRQQVSLFHYNGLATSLTPVMMAIGGRNYLAQTQHKAGTVVIDIIDASRSIRGVALARLQVDLRTSIIQKPRLPASSIAS
jgi:hypothetical protein